MAYFLDIPIMIATMAFQRKWVSDSNLDKLWHETLEKKEANKQRRSPDFCKEAILSATLKRISSEMIMRRLSTPSCDIEADMETEKQTITMLSRVTCDSSFEADEGIKISASMNCDDLDNEEYTNNEKENDFSFVEEFLPTSAEFTDICDIDHAIASVDDVQTFTPDSPKRKRNELEEDDDNLLNVPVNDLGVSSSPAKRQRRKAEQCKRNNLKVKPVRNRSKSPVGGHKEKNNASRTNFLGNENREFLNKSDSVVIPVKSVVNSISALSLEVGENWKANSSGSWCIPGKNSTHKDTLELDNFFNNLKKVSS